MAEGTEIIDLEQSLQLLGHHVWASYTIAVLFGLMLGSFVNVMAFRLPQQLLGDADDNGAAWLGGTWPLLGARSKCPHCTQQIRWYENVPLLSYLVLNGRCSNCKEPISPRYPLVEALAAALAVAMIWQFGPTGEALVRYVFCLLLLTLALIDLDHFFLPDALTLPAVWLGLMLNAFGVLAQARDAILGAVCGWAVLAAINLVYRLVSRREGIGQGDWKLAAAIGAWLGFTDMLTALFLAFVVGGIVGIIVLLVYHGDRRWAVPFGPFLAVGGLAEVFLGAGPMNWYLGWVMQSTP